MTRTIWNLCLFLTGVLLVLSFTYRSDAHSVVLVSGSERTSIGEKGEVVHLKRNAFALEFYLKPYNTENKEFNAARIAFLTDEALFKKTKVGKETKMEHYLASGHGMAQYSKGSNKYIHPANDAFNYIYYESPEKHRAELIGEENGFLHLSCKFENLLTDFKKAPIPLKETDIDTLYLVMFFDKNHNEVIDKGELAKAKLVFHD